MTQAAECPATLNFTLPDIDGKPKSLCDYKGQVLLVVNVASQCGYTKQYAGLERIHQKYKSRGFAVLGFPSNQFGGQEPGTEQEIKEFCSTKFNVSFDLFAKSDVKGRKANPFYSHLTSERKDYPHSGPISWNFNKFLIGRDGSVIARFKSGDDPESKEITTAIEKAL